MASGYFSSQYPTLVEKRRYRVVRRIQLRDTCFEVGDPVTLRLWCYDQYAGAFRAVFRALLIAINSHDELVDHGNIRELNRGFNWWRVGVHVSSRGPLWTVRVSEPVSLPGLNRWGNAEAGSWSPVQSDPAALPFWPRLNPLFELLRSRGWSEMPHAWQERPSGEERQLGDHATLYEALFREV
jgi:hypothetical protein